MQPASMKVGELAKKTGISVRTLHHYDAIGLLSPRERTDAGYRLYGPAEIARLQQVVSLRQLGLSLQEIGRCLAGADYPLYKVIEMHIADLRSRITKEQALCDRLEALADHLRSTGGVPVEELVTTIAEMMMFEKYYTPEQLEELSRRRDQVGEQRIHEVEAEWPRLMAEVRAEMDKGTDPASETVRRLARRWKALVDEFTGGNPQIERSLRNMYEHEPSVHGMETAPMREMASYISRALEASTD